MKIIFDYNRTLFNPDTNELYQGAFDLLQNLSNKHELFLVSRDEPGRMNRFKNLGIEKYFKKIVFTPNKTKQVFEDFGGNSSDTFVVGDCLRDEISLGNQLEFITVRIKQSRFAIEIPTKPERPTHTISDIRELEDVISQYEK